MIGLTKNWNGGQDGNVGAWHDAGRQGSDAIAPVQSRKSWDNPAPAHSVEAGLFQRPPINPRRNRPRRRADYRELLAIELEAKKLNLCRPPRAARPSLDQDSPAHEGASGLEENDRAVETPLAALNSESLACSDAHRPVVMVVDQRMNMHFGSGRDLKSVIAVKIAAMIAWRMLASRKPVGTIIFNDKRTVQFGLGCNRLHTMLTMQELVNQNHDLPPNGASCSNPRMLNDALRSVKKLAADPLIFLITDASGRDEETFRLATGISHNNNLVIVLIYDPFQMKFLGFARHRRFDRCFFPEGVPVVTINTRMELKRQLRRSLRTSTLRLFAAERPQPAGHSTATPPWTVAP